MNKKPKRLGGLFFVVFGIVVVLSSPVVYFVGLLLTILLSLFEFSISMTPAIVLSAFVGAIGLALSIYGLLGSAR